MKRSPLERDLSGLVARHGLFAVIHALVEACHALATHHTGKQYHEARVADICSHLRAAEERAQRHNL